LNGIHRKAKKTTKRRSIPGLKQAILGLKTINPNISKDEVAQTLIKGGFDFQGKSPKRAVHMVWVNMGYTKKDRLPDLEFSPASEFQKQREQQDLFSGTQQEKGV
jgi:hypothetical protein